MLVSLINQLVEYLELSQRDTPSTPCSTYHSGHSRWRLVGWKKWNSSVVSILIFGLEPTEKVWHRSVLLPSLLLSPLLPFQESIKVNKTFGLCKQRALGLWISKARSSFQVSLFLVSSTLWLTLLVDEKSSGRGGGSIILIINRVKAVCN